MDSKYKYGDLFEFGGRNWQLKECDIVNWEDETHSYIYPLRRGKLYGFLECQYKGGENIKNTAWSIINYDNFVANMKADSDKVVRILHLIIPASFSSGGTKFKYIRLFKGSQAVHEELIDYDYYHFEADNPDLEFRIEQRRFATHILIGHNFTRSIGIFHPDNRDDEIDTTTTLQKFLYKITDWTDTN